MMSPLRRLVAVLIVALATTACAVPLRTGTQQGGCDLALARGRLVQDQGSGLGLADAQGNVTPVAWPFGYTARRDLAGVVLVDRDGEVVAREGDTVEIGGGSSADDKTFVMCSSGEVHVIPSPG